jgi:MFS family permease
MNFHNQRSEKGSPMDAATLSRRGSGATQRRETLSLAALASAVFLAFMTIGLPLPVIPLFVGHRLGFGNVIVGAAVGIQFLATILTRGFAGREADRNGARKVMLRGMLFCACSGIALILSAQADVPDAARLPILIAGRLVLGFGESQLVVGMLGWGIGTVGQARSGTVLAWTGMAIYGAVAAAAPLGFWLYGVGGLGLVGAAAIVLPAIGALIAWPVAGVTPHGGKRQSFWRVIGLIWQPGLSVLLQGVGFATLGAFISLDFAAHRWAGTGAALSCFGGAFVLMRILFGRLPDRTGGIPIAIVSFAVEAVGQVLLFCAPTSPIALLGAFITGAGCSMIFPALGVEIVRLVPPQIRATALGGFAAFQDLAYGVTGPVAGLFATSFGYPSVFAVGGVCAMGGLVMTIAMARGALGWHPRR